MASSFVREVKPVIRHALMWGIAWGLVGTAGVTLDLLIGRPMRPGDLLMAVGLVVRFVFWGVVLGGIFATALRLLFRGKGRGLLQMHWLKFGLLGGVIAGAALPLALQLLNILGDGHMIAWSLVLDDSKLGFVFGGGAAAVAMKLAQRTAASADAAEPAALERGDPFATTAPATSQHETR